MKIGLLSDTHSYFPEEVFKYFGEADEIWHAGDIGSLEVTDKLKAFKPIRAVYGNIDDHTARNEFNETEIFEIDGFKVLLTHIAGRPGKYQRNIDKLISETKPNLVICGHSHTLLVQFDKQLNTLWMNPGACGTHGFHKIRTFLRFEINNGKIENLEAIELGSRTQIQL
jgi:putative phosphoesterase